MYEDMKFVGGEEVINESINEVSKHSHKLLAKKNATHAALNEIRVIYLLYAVYNLSGHKKRKTTERKASFH